MTDEILDENILEHYDRNCFKFSESYLRMSFPSSFLLSPKTDPVSDLVTDLVTDPVKKLILLLDSPKSITDLMEAIGLKHKPTFRTNYLQKALELELIELTIPEKPSSRNQKYKITEKGKRLRDKK